MGKRKQSTHVSSGYPVVLPEPNIMAIKTLKAELPHAGGLIAKAIIIFPPGARALDGGPRRRRPQRTYIPKFVRHLARENDMLRIVRRPGHDKHAIAIQNHKRRRIFDTETLWHRESHSPPTTASSPVVPAQKR